MPFVTSSDALVPLSKTPGSAWDLTGHAAQAVSVSQDTLLVDLTGLLSTSTSGGLALSKQGRKEKDEQGRRSC